MADGGEDGTHHRTGDGDLGQLEKDGAGVADDAGTKLDQFELQVDQRPLGHFLGQFDTAQEDGQIVGQRIRLQIRATNGPISCYRWYQGGV